MILVTGGTGFVGKEIVRKLLEMGCRVRVLSRKPQASTDHRVEFFPADISNPETLRGCCSGVRCVVHLVGILFPANGNSYESAHIDATRNILEEARLRGVSRFIHMSAIGTREGATSRYHQTKWEAEELVRQSDMNWTIFRPSLIYGQDDAFVKLFLHMLTFPRSIFNAFTLPCIGDGKTIFRPLGVDEVADCFVRSIGLSDSNFKTIDLVGHPISFRRLLEEIALAKGLRPTFLEGPAWTLPFKIPPAILFRSHPVMFPVPYSIARAALAIRLRIPGCEWLLGPPIDPDVLTMLAEDQRGDESIAKELFHFQPRTFSQGISSFVYRLKK